MNTPQKKPQVPAARNTLQILALLSSIDVPISAARIRRELGLPRSTTYHLLGELVDSGFAVHLPEHRTYGLGLAAYEMASAYATQQPLVRAAPPCWNGWQLSLGDPDTYRGWQGRKFSTCRKSDHRGHIPWSPKSECDCRRTKPHPGGSCLPTSPIPRHGQRSQHLVPPKACGSFACTSIYAGNVAGRKKKGLCPEGSHPSRFPCSTTWHAPLLRLP